MRLCNHCTCTLGSLAQLLDTFTDLTLVLRDSKLDRIRETLTEGLHLDFIDQVLHILPVANKENINSVFTVLCQILSYQNLLLLRLIYLLVINK